MNSRLPLLLLFAAASAFRGLSAGCAHLGEEARRSDGLLDFLQARAGHLRRDALPVERVSGRTVEIVTAHAEADRAGRTRVSGMLDNIVFHPISREDCEFNRPVSAPGQGSLLK